ncbi:MAG TPA: nodulation protein NfeD [Burkholderiaceae bacterium]|nr:nodulation protein NfeD [Burkholderiaceae bacterium]
MAASATVVPAAQAAPAPVAVMRVDGAIGAATADHLHRALARAAEAHAQLAVLQLDTPGGLDVAMRSIIKDMLASPVPVAVFVAPNGARAASAGTYLLYASHVAAMAPATNLGAATPVALGMPGLPAPSDAAPASAAASGAAASDTLTAKRISDAAAYLRSLAQLRGRNADWAERAVRESVSLAAHEALRLGVIDLVAQDVPDLLRRLDGREIRLGERSVRLATQGAPLLTIEADWRSRLLSVIADPSLALILMMIGIYGLLFEFANPGFVLPGVAGAICLVLALFALQMLPVNYAGLAMILLGVGFFAAEAFVPSYGTLGLGGAVAFASGALLLIDSDSPGFGVSPVLVGVLTAGSAAFVIFVAGMAAKARRRPLVSGPSALLGAAGELVEFAAGEGWALVQGEHWKVHGGTALRPGDRVRVTRVRGALLEVEETTS